MAKHTVTVVDTIGIQPYIFGSNRLQENIGASELVNLATGQWALEALTKVIKSPEKHNVLDAARKKLKDQYEIDKLTNEKAAEVIYSGGGNTVIIFNAPAIAREFAYQLTSRVLREAPGLSLVVAHDDDFEWENQGRPLGSIVKELIGKRLAEQKASRLPSTPLLGLGVTAACESTGLVAMRTNEGLKLSKNESTRLISRETEAKLAARNKANQRLKRLFDRELRNWYEFPSDMDKLGRVKGEESYVAVIHADGNQMGKHIEKIALDHPRAEDFIAKMRDFSCKVEEASLEALRSIVSLLTRRVTWEQGKEYVAERVPMDGIYLPFRPLVFGGDDVTFVCNGVLGLSLAVEYLKAFEAQTEKILKEKLHASAGISIVKMHYPFARAYAMSEQLAKSAKGHIWKKYGGNASPSALDWHIATSGLSGSLTTIRKREYESDEKTLLMRPVLLRPEAGDPDGRAWIGRLEKAIREFQNGKSWVGKRNKVKRLQEELRKGLNSRTEEISNFMRDFELPQLPKVTGFDRYRENGWDLERCGYFDAIELGDYYLHLPFEEEEQ